MNSIAVQPSDIAPGSIVVGVAEVPSEAALDWAVGEAKITGRKVTLVHAVRPLQAEQRTSLARMGVSPEALVRDEQAAAHEHLEGVAETVRAEGVLTDVAVVVGDPRDVLIAVSASAFRVVVGSRGRGSFRSRLLGSVSSSIVRHSECPAVVVRPRRGRDVTEGVVVSARATAEGRAALEAAFLETDARRSSLVVVCDPRGVPASDRGPVDRTMSRRNEVRLGVAEAVAGLQEDHPDVAVSTRVTDGSLLDALLDVGNSKDLIVIERPGEDGRRGQFGLAASLSASLVEHASTTVMVVP